MVAVLMEALPEQLCRRPTARPAAPSHPHPAFPRTDCRPAEGNVFKAIELVVNAGASQHTGI